MGTTDAFVGLTKNHVFPEARFSVSRRDAEAYLAATGDEAFRALAHSDDAPPLATTALALRALLGTLKLPPGAVHTGEDVEFARPARYGEPLRCVSKVVQASERQGHRFTTIEQRVFDDAGERVLVARAAVIAPLPAGNGAS